jgi:hypothetical protein
VAAAGVFFVLVWFRDSLVDTTRRGWHRIEARLVRKRFVLLWIDDQSISEKLCGHLSRLDSEGNLYRVLDRPTSISLYPLSEQIVRAIIILDTDVSKLADSDSAQVRLQQQLGHYVSRGGALIASHDVIYRRVRCTELQDMFGCTITEFYQCPPEEKVHYQVDAKAANHPIRAGLSDNFELDDGEVVAGPSWPPDVDVIYATADSQSHPLVVTREYAQGKLVWLNSGDKGDYMCQSLARPEEPLVRLLVNCVNWAGR